MNIDEILTLVQAVSDSKLTSFKLDQGDMHISLKKKQRSSQLVHLALSQLFRLQPLHLY